MAYTGYYSEQELRDKLGNTIGGNYSIGLLANARIYGDNKVDGGTHREQTMVDSGDANYKHGWQIGEQYFGLAKTISMEYAVAFVRSTQLNVSIQSLREYNQAETDLKGFYELLISLGLVQSTGRFAVDEFVTDVLNPRTGTIVTGLGGIVRKSRFGSLEDQTYRL
jgi:hypothetical protein